MAPAPTTIARGALAGAVAGAVWIAQQPLDRRIFGVPYDDAALLGDWVHAPYPVGVALHVANGAAFGAVFAAVRPSLPVPAVLRGPLAGMTEHLATWPATALLPRLHPAGAALPVLWGSGRAFAQATWRHLLFGTILGELERRLNPTEDDAPIDPAAAASNGHGSAAHLVATGPAGS